MPLYRPLAIKKGRVWVTLPAIPELPGKAVVFSGAAIL